MDTMCMSMCHTWDNGLSVLYQVSTWAYLCRPLRRLRARAWSWGCHQRNGRSYHLWNLSPNQLHPLAVDHKPPRRNNDWTTMMYWFGRHVSARDKSTATDCLGRCCPVCATVASRVRFLFHHGSLSCHLESTPDCLYFVRCRAYLNLNQ